MPGMASPVEQLKSRAAVLLSARARYFRVLSDPTRLAIIELLRERELAVSDLVDALGAPQSRVSNHLACLKWCNFVESERRGRQVFYRLADPRVAELVDLSSALSKEQCAHLSSCERIGPDWI